MLNNNGNNQLNVLDILNILSFFIGVLNLDQNLTQNDKQELMSEVDGKTAEILSEIQKHLENQDRKIDELMEMFKNDSR